MAKLYDKLMKFLREQFHIRVESWELWLGLRLGADNICLTLRVES